METTTLSMKVGNFQVRLMVKDCGYQVNVWNGGFLTYREKFSKYEDACREFDEQVMNLTYDELD